MILFLFILYFSMMIVGGLIFIQVFCSLLTGKDNENLRDFSANLITFINQILLFLSYNDDRRPFPFASWGEVSTEDLVKNDSSGEDEAVIENSTKNKKNKS